MRPACPVWLGNHKDQIWKLRRTYGVPTDARISGGYACARPWTGSRNK